MDAQRRREAAGSSPLAEVLHSLGQIRAATWNTSYLLVAWHSDPSILSRKRSALRHLTESHDVIALQETMVRLLTCTLCLPRTSTGAPSMRTRTQQLRPPESEPSWGSPAGGPMLRSPFGRTCCSEPGRLRFCWSYLAHILHLSPFMSTRR